MEINHRWGGNRMKILPRAQRAVRKKTMRKTTSDLSTFLIKGLQEQLFDKIDLVELVACDLSW